MARMIPEEPGPETESRAERTVFERLRDGTSDELVAYHGVAWQTPGKGGRPEQGESDFVLAHPRYGVLTLEIKGGSIRFDAATGTWSSTGKSGEQRIKDPVAQARRASHLLQRTLARAKRSGGVTVSFGHAVAFPDCRVERKTLKTDLPRELVFDHGDLAQLDERVDGLFRYWFDQHSKQPLEEAGLELVDSVLARSFDLSSPLVFALRDEEQRLFRLTEQQFSVLDMLSRNQRAAIAGCAGSGKTFLAVEKARRLTAQGFRPLIVVFNVLLADHLRRGLHDVPEIDVRAFYGLCRDVADAAGIQVPDEPEPDGEGAYYRELAAIFAEHSTALEGRWDALIVDEGQDVSADWWLPLQLLLPKPDESPLYVFFDDNQKLFAVPTGLPMLDHAFQLTVNCRNTKRINELVIRFYKGGTQNASGPDGPPIDRHVCATAKELLEQLDEAVAGWIGKAEVAPSDIALLSGYAAHRSALWKVDALGGIRLTDDPWEPNAIFRCSVFRFKGLERMVVGLCELDGVREQALYVGLSRPSVFLSLFASQKAMSRLGAG
ncbi:MAG TPA: NERD domain-containing protein/DEAD/DEAH box helicase [Gaiellaceae bacterium]|nr:NERD domain-containing protein/DEAD/DEAH box helicase [Gaiellaceae bacterium]